MEVEQAQTPWRKCCFCIPLRKGLLFLAYLNVVGLVLAMLTDMKGIMYFDSVTDMLAGVVMTNYIESLVWIWLLPFFMDLVFGIILIYAVHKNNAMVLYAYMWYGVTQILIEVYVGLAIYAHVYSKADLLFCVAFYVFYQGYITLLVRTFRIELNAAKAVDKSSYRLKQATNERDVESQPLPTAPSGPENTVLEK